LWLVSLEDKKTSPVGAIESTSPINAMFSPDGRWVAYTIGPGGRTKIFVQPFPPTGARYQLFLKENDHPYAAVWSPSGNELIYIPRSGAMEAVAVTTSPTFAFGNPVSIVRSFAVSFVAIRRPFDITPDGKFLAVHAGNASEIQVVLNWFDELRAAVK
jgi:eukaryotic-like serine/threonine-protein kinase